MEGFQREGAALFLFIGVPEIFEGKIAHIVTEIVGRGRLEGVVLCQVDEQGRLCPGTERRVDCDTLLLSVGLIPENEVGAQAGIALTR